MALLRALVEPEAPNRARSHARVGPVTLGDACWRGNAKRPQRFGWMCSSNAEMFGKCAGPARQGALRVLRCAALNSTEAGERGEARMRRVKRPGENAGSFVTQSACRFFLACPGSSKQRNHHLFLERFAASLRQEPGRERQRSTFVRGHDSFAGADGPRPSAHVDQPRVALSGTLPTKHG